MTQRLPRPCPACDGQIRASAIGGRRMPLHHIPDLEVPADLSIPTCDGCGEMFIDGPTAEALDAALGQAYEVALAAKADSAIRELARFIPQRDVEALLGLSGGYLSRVKAGAQKTPSAHLVAALMLMADDPCRVAELRHLWRMHPVTGHAVAALPRVETPTGRPVSSVRMVCASSTVGTGEAA